MLDREPAVIPAALMHHLVEPPGIRRDRGVQQPGTVAIGPEGVSATIVPHLVAAACLDPVVVTGVEGKEDPESAERIVVKDQEEAVGLGIDLNPHVLPLPEPPLVVHPEANGGSRGGGRSGSR